MEQPQTSQSENLPQIIERTPLVDVDVLTRGEIDIQVATAQRYPRVLAKCKADLLTLACVTQVTAGKCTYSIPIGGSPKRGPSAYFARLLARAWKHIRVQGRIIGSTDTEAIAEGICWDLECNVAFRREARRTIIYSETNRKGQRYVDHMVTATTLVVQSIAERKAILATIPEPLWQHEYDQIVDTARGAAATLEKRRTEAMRWFDAKGIKPDQVLQLVNLPSWEDAGLDDVVEMHAIAEAIRTGEVTVLELLAEITKKPENGGTTSLQDAIDKRKKGRDADGKVHPDTTGGRPADPVQPGSPEESQPASDPTGR